MYTKHNTVYADPCKILQGHGLRAYQAQGSPEQFTELDCPYNDLTVCGGIARWAGGLIAMAIDGLKSYDDIKTKLVKLRYSNDDQIAVMLNADPDEMARMQAWREWAADVATEICRKAGIR